MDNDRALIQSIRHGDPAAFDTLIKTHVSELTRFAYDFTKSEDLANDVVDDVFIWIWEHRETWEVKGSLRGYLFGAARNRALNVRRNTRFQEQWQDTHEDNRTAAGLGQPPAAPNVRVEQHELRELLRKSIESLPERRQTVLQLRWFYGMSYTEIAEVQGTTVIGVKQQLNRALRALREALPEHLR